MAVNGTTRHEPAGGAAQMLAMAAAVCGSVYPGNRPENLYSLQACPTVKPLMLNVYFAVTELPLETLFSPGSWYACLW